MIDWIKFSERQPTGSKSHGKYYLCSYGDNIFQFLQWDYHASRFEKEGHHLKSPDYWAEINPPRDTIIFRGYKRRI